jgi:hypothetical protein
MIKAIPFEDVNWRPEGLGKAFGSEDVLFRTIALDGPLPEQDYPIDFGDDVVQMMRNEKQTDPARGE